MEQWRIKWEVDSTSKSQLQIGFKVSWILFTQMTKANTQSCNKFDSSMIFSIKIIIGGWPDKSQDIVFKGTKASGISNVMVKIVPLDSSWEKKQIFKKLCFVLKRGMFSILLVVKGDRLKGTNLKIYWADSCL